MIYKLAKMRIAGGLVNLSGVAVSPEKGIFIMISKEEEKLCFGRGKILLMDDQEAVREMIGEMLNYLGYEVIQAREGDEAIELYERERQLGHPFKAVILDLTVPSGLGGAEAIDKLKKIDPKVRAIVSSGYSDDPIMINYREHGFQGVVAKPYEIEELSEVLHKVVLP